jgi:hypothetical protein
MWPRKLAWSAGAVALAVAVPAPFAGASPAASPAAAIRVEPRVIEVGMLHRGATVRVEGTAPAGFRLALECVGEEGQVQLKRKGKVWSLLWMNVGSVTFDRVPSIYLAHSDPEGVPAEAQVLPAEPRLAPGYGGVEAQVLPADADPDARRLFREFVRLKEGERLYALATLRRDAEPDESVSPPGAILVGLASPAGQTRVSAEFALPAGAPAGEHEVRMLGYRDGVAAVLASEKLSVKRVGLAHLVATAAQRHGLLYGILSVAVALAAGLLSGVLFSGAKKSH